MKDKKQNKRINGGHRLLFFCILCLFGLYVAVSYAEEQPQREQSKTKVILLHTDNLTYDQYRHPGAQILTGNVQFQHDGVLMYCDSACFYEATNSFDAFGLCANKCICIPPKRNTNAYNNFLKRFIYYLF